MQFFLFEIFPGYGKVFSLLNFVSMYLFYTICTLFMRREITFIGIIHLMMGMTSYRQSELGGMFR